MYEIRESHRTISGVEVTTYRREVVGANILEVEAGTNGCQGGDAGHGSRTYFRIQDASSTAINVRRLDGAFDQGFEVEMSGDSELATAIEALRFIVHVLEDMKRGPHL